MMQGMEWWGTAPPPEWHHNPNSGANFALMTTPQFHPLWNGSSDDGANLVGTSDARNKAAAYSRALRKSCLLHQRGYSRARRNQSDSVDKLRHQSRQRRGMSNLKWCKHFDPEFVDESREGFQFLFQKELRASDVSSLGRIILPKKDAERHLPALAAREGIRMSLKDYQTGQYWTARYRFWPNNKSRMYLLENIGGFVSFHKLEEGDFLICYRNPQGAYVIRGRKVAAQVKSSLRREAKRDSTEARETTTRPVVLESYKDESNSTGSSDASNPSLGTQDRALEEFFGATNVDDSISGPDDCFAVDVGSAVDWHDEDLGAGLLPSFQLPLLDLDFDPAEGMLYVPNVKQRYSD